MASTVDRLLAVLFVASEPASLPHLAQSLGVSQDALEADLRQLEEQLASGPLQLTRHNGAVRLVTKPEFAPDIRTFLQAEVRAELSRPSLETLAIIAYRGPLTRVGLEAIRGVSSEVMLRNLLARDLITQAGAALEPGKPMRYQLSQHALELLGLASLDQLPPLPEGAEEVAA